MAVNPITRKRITDFFLSLVPVRKAFSGSSFSFIALKASGGAFKLVRGTLHMNVKASQIPYSSFRSNSVLAGHFNIADVGKTEEEFVAAALDGVIETPFGNLIFPHDANVSGHKARFDLYNAAGLQEQRRLTTLQIYGSTGVEALNNPELDWELRASPTPYDGVHELAGEFKPGLISETSTLEVIAHNLVAVHGSSAIDEEDAKISVICADDADPSKITIGFRVVLNGKTISRGLIDPSVISWAKGEIGPIGTAELKVPKGSIVHIVANYNGVAQQHYYIADGRTLHNHRRAVFETIDPHLGLLKESLEAARGVRPQSRNFEASVSWLFWMLGFAPAHLGQIFSEAPDTIVAAPNGNVAVIEVTTNVFDDGKLAKLHARTQAVRAALLAANGQHLKVLPVIVTALSRADIAVTYPSAQARGIFVLTREGIEEMLLRTSSQVNADQVFEQAFEAAREAQEAISKSKPPQDGN